MDDKTRAFVKELLGRHGGNVELTARFMRDTLRIGGIRACRELIAEALKA